MTEHGRRLAELRIRHDREVAAQHAREPRQEPLPFGDGWLDGPDDEIEFHGTNVGIQRHADAGEDLCPPCAALVADLVADGYARPVED